jgi:hypothetical protein
MADLPARAGSALENKTKMKRAARLISTGPRDIDGMQRLSCARVLLAHREVRGMVLDALHEGRELRRLYWA